MTTPKTAPAKTTPRKPQDHLAAAKAEATGDSGSVTFEFDGDTYTVAGDALDDLDLMEYVEADKYILAIRGYLGAEQWERWKDAHRTKDGRASSARLGDFLQALTEAVGAGNS